ncbi:dodecin family protein [Natranaerobius thermophilus]|uniref:Dodecin n=1 Tax=Natranaerobius thermophilus (strain ATCC BAA-1301 / DSM 18059 / JW/NM-WN-LF) TaxID=457570 RepID=B2A4Z2_NATTJ|nr:dodecin family protein [Natranaerobius thermophilus]ACB85234.1 protein of unknown function DUF1458 [Natranaerobius thermophilus JW/NM-WN-LF]
MDTVKVVELVGESTESWEQAIENAVHEASKTIDNIAGVEVYNMTADVDNGRLVEYKANVKVAFGIKK